MTKKCGKCLEDKPTSAFARKVREKDGLQSTCRACKNLYNKSYYNRTKLIHNPARTARKKDHEDKLRDLVYERMSSTPCVDCGSTNWYTFHMDHRDPSKKSFTISQAVKGRPYTTLDKMREELDKCDVVCANCHALRTPSHYEPKMLWERKKRACGGSNPSIPTQARSGELE